MKPLSLTGFPSPKSSLVLTCAATSFLLTGMVLSADNVWIGGTSSDYNVDSNWSLGRVPNISSGDSLAIPSTPGNVATLTTNAAAQVVDIRIGESNATGTFGTLLHSAGVLSSGPGNWTAIGAGNDGAGSFATGVYNLTSLSPAGGTLTGFAQGSGTLNANSRLYVGGTEDGAYGTGGNGTLNINTTGTVNVSENLIIAGRGATGTLNMDSGTVNVSSQLFVGNNDGGTGTLRISGGTINVNSWLGVGRDGSNGTMTISGTGTVNQGITDAGSRFEMTNFSKPTNATVNLDGGTLHINGINNNGGGTTNFNFNGGVLKARIDNGGFMGGLTAATVMAGGAKIDTDGHNITIGQQLVGTVGDGGLVKSGEGTLELGASNTFNGPTVVNGGTLKLNNGSSPGTLGGDGSITINNGATLASGAVDGTGYFNHTANNAININEGGTLRVLEGGRLSMDRTINSIGGTIASTGTTFDNAASYAFRYTGNGPVNSYNFTSSPGGVPSTISATNVGVDNVTFTVTQGGGPIDLNVTGNVKDTFGTGGITKAGNGVMVLANTANTYSGPTVISGGILNVASVSDYGVDGSLGNRAADGPGNVGILFRGGTLQYTGSTAQSTNRAVRISTDGGGGTIDASGSNPAATLSFTATSTPDFFENPGSRTLTLTGTNTGNNTFGMPVTETGGQTSLVKNGPGTWVLLGNNTYSGGTTVNQGKLVITDNKTGSSNFVVNGQLEFQLNSGTQQLNGGSITGTGSIIKSGSSVLMLGGNLSPQTIGLSGATSVIDVQGGVLRNEYGNNAYGTNKASLNVATGAVFDIWDGDTRVDYLSGSGSINKGWSNNNDLAIGVNNGSGTFSGTIYNNKTDFGYGGNGGGEFSLTKEGTGKQTLTGVSGQIGKTIINAGTLELGGGGTLTSTKGIDVNSGTMLVTSTASDRINDLATISLNANSSSTPALQFDGAPGTSITESLGQLSVLGSASSVSILDLGNLQDGGSAGVRLTFNSTGVWTGTLQVWNWTGSLYTDGGVDQLDGFAAAPLDPTQLASIQFYSGSGGATAIGSGAAIVNGELVAAPEPSTVMALLLGLVPFMRRKRR